MLHRSIGGVTLPERRAPKLTTPEAADVAKILAQAEDQYGVPLGLAASTGLRRGEVLALRWCDVHLEGHCGHTCGTAKKCWLEGTAHVSVNATLQRVDGGLVRMPPKSSRSERAVPLDAGSVRMLKRHKADQNQRKFDSREAWVDPWVDKEDSKAKGRVVVRPHR